MNVHRGDVVLAHFPFSSGTTTSRRPVLVVQADHYNQRLTNTIVAQITSNLARACEQTHLLIEVATPEGKHSGLLHDSVVSCVNLATIQEQRIDRVIGLLSGASMKKIDACLKAALGIP